MRSIGILCLGLAFLTAPHAGLAEPASDPVLAKKAESLIQPIAKADQFSGTVLVTRNGVPVFQRAYGLANREWSVPNTIETKFRIGSITKQFTAAAILQLQEAGKLSVDDSVSKYYTDAPASWNGITIRNLLTHTSGIPDHRYADQADYYRQARTAETPDDYIKPVLDMPLNFAPGRKFVYDNMGYIILGYIIEKVSGESYAGYLQQHIFAPLEMTASGYDDTDEAIIPELASGYHFAKGKYTDAAFISMTQIFSAGALYSTAGDLRKWDQALVTGKILSPSSRQAMFTDYGYGYGFGWFVDKEFGHQHISHGGIITGYTATRFDRYPDDKLTIIVLSNEDNAPVGHISDELAVMYLGIPPRQPAAGGDALIRSTIEDLRAGTPSYDHMGPQMAQATRTHIPILQKVMIDLGAVKAVTLTEAEPDGIDRYNVTFQNGAAEWDARTAPDGTLLVYPAVFPME